MATNKPRTSSRYSRAIAKMTTVDDVVANRTKATDVNQGTSPRINEYEVDGTTTWYRPCDDMRPQPSPDKNKAIATPEGMNIASSGGVRSMDTHYGHTNSGNRMNYNSPSFR